MNPTNSVIYPPARPFPPFRGLRIFSGSINQIHPGTDAPAPPHPRSTSDLDKKYALEKAITDARATTAAGSPIVIKNLDLTDLDLTGDCLSLIMLEHSYVTFEHCDFTGANLSGLNLSRVTFSKCHLNGVDFSNCDLTGTKIDVYVKGPRRFHGCKFDGANIFPAPKNKHEICIEPNNLDLRLFGVFSSDFVGMSDAQLTSLSLKGAHLDLDAFLMFHELAHPELHLARPFITPNQFNDGKTHKMCGILQGMKATQGADTNNGRLEIRVAFGDAYSGNVPQHIWDHLADKKLVKLDPQSKP